MVGVYASVNLLCTIRSRSSFLAPAHPDGPGKRPVIRLWCGVVVRSQYMCVHVHLCVDSVPEAT